MYSHAEPDQIFYVVLYPMTMALVMKQVQLILHSDLAYILKIFLT